MMKKSYMKPLIEIESYTLSASLAYTCGNPVTLGPEAPGKTTCDEFKDAFEVFAFIPGLGIQGTSTGTPFYSDGKASCDCYYSSGGAGYFTS